MASAANFATPYGKACLPPLQPQKPRRRETAAAFFRRMLPTAHGTWLVALAAGILIGSHRVSAEDAQHPSVIHLGGVAQSLDTDLVVICPQSSAAEPQFQNQQTGKILCHF